MSNKNKTLGEFIIENQTEFKYSSGELSRLINSIRLAAKVVNHEVNKAGLVDILGTAGETNVQGEDQQKLDVYANDVFIKTLINREIVCGIASEEEDDFITIGGRNEKNDNKCVELGNSWIKAMETNLINMEANLDESDKIKHKKNIDNNREHLNSLKDKIAKE